MSRWPRLLLATPPTRPTLRRPTSFASTLNVRPPSPSTRSMAADAWHQLISRRRRRPRRRCDGFRGRTGGAQAIPRDVQLRSTTLHSGRTSRSCSFLFEGGRWNRENNSRILSCSQSSFVQRVHEKRQSHGSSESSASGGNEFLPSGFLYSPTPGKTACPSRPRSSSGSRVPPVPPEQTSSASSRKRVPHLRPVLLLLFVPPPSPRPLHELR